MPTSSSAALECCPAGACACSAGLPFFLVLACYGGCVSPGSEDSVAAERLREMRSHDGLRVSGRCPRCCTTCDARLPLGASSSPRGEAPLLGDAVRGARTVASWLGVFSLRPPDRRKHIYRSKEVSQRGMGCCPFFILPDACSPWARPTSDRWQHAPVAVVACHEPQCAPCGSTPSPSARHRARDVASDTDLLDAAPRARLLLAASAACRHLLGVSLLVPPFLDACFIIRLTGFAI